MALNDRLDLLHTFCALVPLTDAAAAQAELARWPMHAGSPFARLPATHFARFVIIPELRRDVSLQPADVLDAPRLMFSAFFDVEPAAYLTALCEAIPDEAHAVLRHCRGCPGHPRDHAAGVRAWLMAHRVAATAIFGAYPGTTVRGVREALAFREAFRRFAFDLEARRSGQARFAAFAAAQEGAA